MRAFIIALSGIVLLLTILSRESFSQEVPVADGIKNGKDVGWYESGVKEYEIPLVNYQKHGTAVWWFESGVKNKEIPYVNDQKHGTAREWDEDGNLVSTTQWENGEEVK